MSLLLPVPSQPAGQLKISSMVKTVIQHHSITTAAHCSADIQTVVRNMKLVSPPSFFTARSMTLVWMCLCVFLIDSSHYSLWVS